ncbi:MAG: hypothetical protein ABSC55_03565 [Syntrophorhabdales bacterium]|jgi:ElaB/YqjD/DUF883 family membrane-anchored ribosome-binding protein
MSDIEKEIQRVNAKLDKLLHALGLDGSRSSSQIRQDAKKVVELHRQKEGLKEKTGGNGTGACR